MPGADSWLRSPHPPAEVPVRPLEDTHTQAHTRCPASQEGSLSLTVGGTGQVCPQGPFLGSGLKRISQHTGLLPSCSMSQSDSSLWGMCPFCRGGSMVEPQARAQSWSQRWPSGSSYSIGRAQVRSPVVWPPRVMRRGLVKVPLWGHEQQGGRRGPHD